MEKLKCQDCKERHVGCHSECEHYLKWKEENDKMRDDVHNKKWLEGLGNTPKKKRRK